MHPDVVVKKYLSSLSKDKSSCISADPNLEFFCVDDFGGLRKYYAIYLDRPLITSAPEKHYLLYQVTSDGIIATEACGIYVDKSFDFSQDLQTPVQGEIRVKNEIAEIEEIIKQNQKQVTLLDELIEKKKVEILKKRKKESQPKLNEAQLTEAAEDELTQEEKLTKKDKELFINFYSENPICSLNNKVVRICTNQRNKYKYFYIHEKIEGTDDYYYAYPINPESGLLEKEYWAIKSEAKDKFVITKRPEKLFKCDYRFNLKSTISQLTDEKPFSWFKHDGSIYIVMRAENVRSEKNITPSYSYFLLDLKDEFLLGKGGQGLVYKVFKVDESGLINISNNWVDKISKYEYGEMGDTNREVANEMSILSSLQKVSGVHIYHLTEDSNYYKAIEKINYAFHTFSEFIPGKNLFHINDDFEITGTELEKLTQLNFNERIKVCTAIAVAFNSIYKKLMVHGDVKGNNIHVYFNPETNSIDIYVLDFGFSYRINIDDPSVMYPIDEIHGSLFFISPETYQRKHGLKSDVFSRALIYITILGGKGYKTRREKLIEVMLKEGCDVINGESDASKIPYDTDDLTKSKKKYNFNVNEKDYTFDLDGCLLKFIQRMSQINYELRPSPDEELTFFVSLNNFLETYTRTEELPLEIEKLQHEINKEITPDKIKELQEQLETKIQQLSLYKKDLTKLCARLLLLSDGIWLNKTETITAQDTIQEKPGEQLESSTGDHKTSKEEINEEIKPQENVPTEEQNYLLSNVSFCEDVIDTAKNKKLDYNIVAEIISKNLKQVDIQNKKKDVADKKNEADRKEALKILLKNRILTEDIVEKLKTINNPGIYKLISYLGDKFTGKDSLEILIKDEKLVADLNSIIEDIQTRNIDKSILYLFIMTHQLNSDNINQAINYVLSLKQQEKDSLYKYINSNKSVFISYFSSHIETNRLLLTLHASPQFRRILSKVSVVEQICSIFSLPKNEKINLIAEIENKKTGYKDIYKMLNIALTKPDAKEIFLPPDQRNKLLQKYQVDRITVFQLFLCFNKTPEIFNRILSSLNAKQKLYLLDEIEKYNKVLDKLFGEERKNLFANKIEQSIKEFVNDRLKTYRDAKNDLVEMQGHNKSNFFTNLVDTIKPYIAYTHKEKLVAVNKLIDALEAMFKDSKQRKVAINNFCQMLNENDRLLGALNQGNLKKIASDFVEYFTEQRKSNAPETKPKNTDSKTEDAPDVSSYNFAEWEI